MSSLTPLSPEIPPPGRMEIPGPIKIAGYLAVIGGFGWFTSGFLQARGIVDLTVSRLMLCGMWACASIFFVAYYVVCRKPRSWAIVTSLLIAAAMFGLDHYVPMGDSDTNRVLDAIGEIKNLELTRLGEQTGSTVQSNRAWVNLEFLIPRNQTRPALKGSTVLINTTLINRGRDVSARTMSSSYTQATSTHIKTSAEIDAMFTALQSIRNGSDGTPRPSVSLGPTQGVFGTLRFVIGSQAVADALRQEKLYLYFGVIATYEDATGRHITEGCGYISGALDVARLCPTHNTQE